MRHECHSIQHVRASLKIAAYDLLVQVIPRDPINPCLTKLFFCMRKGAENPSLTLAFCLERAPLCPSARTADGARRPSSRRHVSYYRSGPGNANLTVAARPTQRVSRPHTLTPNSCNEHHSESRATSAPFSITHTSARRSSNSRLQHTSSHSRRMKRLTVLILSVTLLGPQGAQALNCTIAKGHELFAAQHTQEHRQIFQRTIVS